MKTRMTAIAFILILALRDIFLGSNRNSIHNQSNSTFDCRRCSRNQGRLSLLPENGGQQGGCIVLRSSPGGIRQARDVLLQR